MPDDPLRQQSPALFRAFRAYLRWYVGRQFQYLLLDREGAPAPAAGAPIIVCANHPSWWDPLVFMLLHGALWPDRRGFGPIEAGALGRYGVLRRMGAFGIDPATREGAARFLAVSTRILAEPRAALWITAQGAFSDARVRPIVLRPGVAHLARRVSGAVVLPLALDYVFWNERRPVILARFGDPLPADRARSVADWTARLAGALADTADALAVRAAARDPAGFRIVLRGTPGGVGGVYDLWRRAGALARRDRFDPTHEGGAR